MDQEEMATTRVRRSRVQNIDTLRLMVRRTQLLDVTGYVRTLADGSKRHAAQIIAGERTAIEGELIRRGWTPAADVLPASHAMADLLQANGRLSGEQGPRRSS